MANSEQSHLFSLSELTRVPQRSTPSSTQSRDPETIDLQGLGEGHQPAATLANPSFAVTAGILPLGTTETQNRATAFLERQPGFLERHAIVLAASLVAIAIMGAALWVSRTQPTPLPPVVLAPSPPPMVAPAPVPTQPNRAPAATHSQSLDENASSEAEPVRPIQQSPQKPKVRLPSTMTNAKAAPRTKPAAVTPPTPKRGPCAHCAPQDLGCNIKCRAGG